MEELAQINIVVGVKGVVRVRDIIIEGSEAKIPARIYEPPTNPIGAVVYYHWGGFVAGSIEESDQECRYVSETCGCTVVSVGYRLAPAHRFPAAVVDSFDSLLWTVNNSSKLGVRNGSVAVMGVSAGGNLAAVVSLMARDRGVKVRLQVLVTPVIGFDPFSRSAAIHGVKGSALDMESIIGFTKAYLGDLNKAFDPLFTPIISDLRGAPPALIITAEQDALRDQGETYARRLKEAGVPVISVRINGASHSLDPVSGFVALSLASLVLRRAFSEPGWLSS